MIRYGLVGKTLKHSFSRDYFSRKFQLQELHGYSYENFELEDISAFPQLLQADPPISGLNITIPYKEQVLPFLHEAEKAVQEIGACNCILIDNGKAIGFNTDAAAFRETLEPLLQPGHKQALVLGSGGASKAIRYALRLAGISYQVVSRTKGTCGLKL
jgi:shikimate dehydrogenase